MSADATAPWYRQGLGFRCLGPECGACCSGKHGSGAVWVDPDEIETLAEHLEIGVVELTRRFLRMVDGRASLQERQNLDCIFYRSGLGCSVYAARPVQCRTYPFWSNIIASQKHWYQEAELCPGIDDRESKIPADQILALSSGHPESRRVIPEPRSFTRAKQPS